MIEAIRFSRMSLSQGLHGVTSKRTEFLIVTVMKTSTLTKFSESTVSRNFNYVNIYTYYGILWSVCNVFVVVSNWVDVTPAANECRGQSGLCRVCIES